MAFTYEVGTDLGNTRLLISDTDRDVHIFEDEEVNTFLNLTAIDGVNDVRLAAAQALDTIARSEALLLKKIKLLDITTDGVALAKELRESASQLREDSNSELGIEVIEMGLTAFTRRQLLINDALRNE